MRDAPGQRDLLLVPVGGCDGETPALAPDIIFRLQADKVRNFERRSGKRRADAHVSLHDHPAVGRGGSDKSGRTS